MSERKYKKPSFVDTLELSLHNTGGGCNVFHKNIEELDNKVEVLISSMEHFELGTEEDNDWIISFIQLENGVSKNNGDVSVIDLQYKDIVNTYNDILKNYFYLPKDMYFTKKELDKYLLCYHDLPHLIEDSMIDQYEVVSANNPMVKENLHKYYLLKKIENDNKENHSLYIYSQSKGIWGDAFDTDWVVTYQSNFKEKNTKVTVKNLRRIDLNRVVETLNNMVDDGNIFLSSIIFENIDELEEELNNIYSRKLK